MNVCYVSNYPANLSLSLFSPSKSERRGRTLQSSEAKNLLIKVKIIHCELGALVFIHYIDTGKC